MANKSGKGSSFERDICRQLSLWWSSQLPITRDDIFWRTSGSGARSTSRAKSGKKANLHCGDICAIDPIGQSFIDCFTVEIKRGYSRCTIADLLDKSPQAAEQQYEKWIAKAVEDQKRAGSLYWLLIVRRNQRRATVFMPMDFIIQLQMNVFGNHVVYPQPYLEMEIMVWMENKTLRESVGIIGMPLEIFLETIKPRNILKLLRVKK